MKNKLQYAYSITVFCGVLITAYLMMNKESNARVAMPSMAPQSLRSQAAILNPSLNQLFQTEDQLSKLPVEKTQPRRPSESEAE